MDFVTICRAVYDYDPEDAEELKLTEDDLVYVVNNEDKDWYQAKLQPDADSRVGFIPAAFVEEIDVLNSALVLENYLAQAKDELDLTQDELIEIYQMLDENWCLIKKESKFGFAPISYLQTIENQQEEIEEQLDAEENEQFKEEETPALEKAKVLLEEKRKKPDLSSMKYYKVSVIDKKEKKKATLGIDKEFIFYANQEDKVPVKQWKMEMLKTLVVNNKKLIIQVQDEEVFQKYEFICKLKKDASNIYKSLQIYAKDAKFEEKKSKNNWLVGVFKKESSNKEKKSNLKIVRVDNTPIKINGNVGSGYSTTSESPPPVPEKDIHQNNKPAPVENQYPLALVLYDFEPENNDELGVQANEKIYVIDSSDSDWWKCQVLYDNNSVLEGLVPASFLKMLETEQIVEENKEKERIKSSESPLQKAEGSPEPSKKYQNHEYTEDKLIKQIIEDEEREWTDSSGKFRVSAKFMGYHNNEVELVKVNNVKIKVPIERMCDEDVKYVSNITGLDLTKELQLIKDKKQRIKILREFFVKCGIESEYTISKYCEVFEKEEIDKELIQELDKISLKDLGVKEGDAIKILKHIKSITGEAKDPKKKQIEEDAMLAIKLQEEENKMSWKSFKIQPSAPPIAPALNLGSTSKKKVTNDKSLDIDPRNFQQNKDLEKQQKSNNITINNMFKEENKKKVPVANIFANPAKLPAPLVPLPDSNDGIINFIPTKRIVKNSENTQLVHSNTRSISTVPYKNIFEDVVKSPQNLFEQKGLSTNNTYKSIELPPQKQQILSSLDSQKKTPTFVVIEPEEYQNTFQDIGSFKDQKLPIMHNHSMKNEEHTYPIGSVSRPQKNTLNSNQQIKTDYKSYTNLKKDVSSERANVHKNGSFPYQENFVKDIDNSLKTLAINNKTPTQLARPSNNGSSFSDYISQYASGNTSTKKAGYHYENQGPDTYSSHTGYKEEKINHNSISMQNKYDSLEKNHNGTHASGFSNQYSKAGDTTHNSQYRYYTSTQQNSNIPGILNNYYNTPRPISNDHKYTQYLNTEKKTSIDAENEFHAKYPDLHSVSVNNDLDSKYNEASSKYPPIADSMAQSNSNHEFSKAYPNLQFESHSNSVHRDRNDYMPEIYGSSYSKSNSHNSNEMMPVFNNASYYNDHRPTELLQNYKKGDPYTYKMTESRSYRYTVTNSRLNPSSDMNYQNPSSFLDSRHLPLNEGSYTIGNPTNENTRYTSYPASSNSANFVPNNMKYRDQKENHYDANNNYRPSSSNHYDRYRH